MKIRHVFITLMLIGGTFSMNGQAYKSAVGVKVGDALMGSYKTFFSEKLAFELAGGLGVVGNVDLFGGAFLQFHFPIGSVDNLSWFIGGGPTVAISDNIGFDPELQLGIGGIGGVDYKIKGIPLNVSIDLTPTFFFTGDTDIFLSNRIFGTAAARYVLGGDK